MIELLARAQLIFWDFDGVIKDSVEVKSRAFATLFAPFVKALADRVLAHHEAHGGVSRFEKIPLYLQWAGKSADPEAVARYARQFATLAMQAVIDAPWVPGAKEYLERNYRQQRFVMVSATPQEEMEAIARSLGIAIFFEGIYGAPAKKATVIRAVLKDTATPNTAAIMIGDAPTDLEAAQANEITFILRRTALNESIQMGYSGPQTDDFTL